MTNETIKLSVIMPIYNSETFLERSLVHLAEFIGSLDFTKELILVDDGSKDKSLEIANRFATAEHSYPVKVVPLGQNQGKGAGVAKGMLESKGKYRIFIDSDLAYPPSQILKILASLESGTDVAIANRVLKESRYTISPSFFHYLYTRHLASRVLNFGLRRTILPHCSDSQAGLKGFTAEAAESIFSRQTIKGFSFDVEALFLAEKSGYKIEEIAVDYRYFDEPTTVTFINDALGMIKDIFQIRWNHFCHRYNIEVADTKKHLVINADDYGLNAEVSDGILEASKGGLLKSTSVMTTSKHFESSIEKLKNSDLDIGFHLNLTNGKPLLNPSEIKSIVDKDGNFLSKTALIKKSLLGQIDFAEVYAEAKEQCSKLKDRVDNITHLDGHHHVHVLPTVCEAAERVAREFNIPVVRSPKEGTWSPIKWASVRRFFIGGMSASSPDYWRKRGFESSDWFGGFALGACNEMKDKWLRTIKQIPNGTCEIMVHPGYKSDESDSYNVQREQEVEILLDKDIKAAVKKAGIEIISFKNLGSDPHKEENLRSKGQTPK